MNTIATNKSIVGGAKIEKSSIAFAIKLMPMNCAFSAGIPDLCLKLLNAGSYIMNPIIELGLIRSFG
jgi:hypothetical protein